MRKFVLFFVQLVFVLSISAQNQIKITSANLNLRTDSSASSTVITVIPKGTKVKVNADCDCKWIPVYYNGEIGYVHSKYLKTPKTNNNDSYTGNSAVKCYRNSFGEKVQSPTYYDSAPAGATALCRDGTYSFSRNRRGTCSHHRGVAKWLR